MKKNILELSLITILTTILLLPINKYLITILTLFIYILLIKKTTINKKQNLILFGIIYILIYYLLGLYKYNFKISPIKLSIKIIIEYIIPITILIIEEENIRIHIKNKTLKLIITTLIHVIILKRIYSTTLKTTLLFIILPSISENILLNNIKDKTNIIIYRLITTLYIYIIPIQPNLDLYTKSYLKMIYPYIIYTIINKKTKINIITITITTLLTMLVSCKFTYGILVIGSESMKKELNIGDVVLYKKYKNQKLKNGDIIIFNQDGIKIVHRIIKINNTNNEIRYITKGDNNKEEDGYQTKENIIGKEIFKIKYIGYPTIWLKLHLK